MQWLVGRPEFPVLFVSTNAPACAESTAFRWLTSVISTITYHGFAAICPQFWLCLLEAPGPPNTSGTLLSPEDPFRSSFTIRWCWRGSFPHNFVLFVVGISFYHVGDIADHIYMKSRTRLFTGWSDIGGGISCLYGASRKTPESHRRRIESYLLWFLLFSDFQNSFLLPIYITWIENWPLARLHIYNGTRYVSV